MKKHKTFERKLTHNCSLCQASFTLRETHLRIKTKAESKYYCADNCVAKWEELLFKQAQEKVLGKELEIEDKETFNKVDQNENKEKNHGNN